MLIRIVKMDFKSDKIVDFIELFNCHKTKIRAFAGCQFLELYQDKNNPNIFFTYSFWEGEQALKNYRNSELFVSSLVANKTAF